MGAPAIVRMTADQFIAWAMNRPDGRRHELVAGEVVAMSPERVSHSRAKAEAWRALREAIQRRGLPCEAIIDGISVRIDDETVYEPDALVRCGDRLHDETVEISDPLIVVEVTSPSSHRVDVDGKLDDYFRLPSVRHYLIVKTRTRSVIHHRREDDGSIRTCVTKNGELTLDPPGITVEVERFFA